LVPDRRLDSEYNSTNGPKFHVADCRSRPADPEKARNMSDLQEEARRWGIEPGYHDVFGQWHAADADTLQLLIEALARGRAQPPQIEAPPAEAPIRAWQGDGRRHWIVAVQLYSLRSQRNWGIGDFTDLAKLVGIAAAHGASGVGVNPLHALFPDQPERASPYAPNSRLFLNPLYIDVAAVPEFPGLAAAGLEDEVAALRGTALVDYARVALARLSGLRLAYQRFRSGAEPQRRADFENFRREQGEKLLRFACFEVLREEFSPSPWPEWSAPWRSPTRPQLDDYRRANLAQVEFQEFMQFVADRQLAACKHAARGHRMPVGLYTDLAVGIDPHGADAWSRQDAVLSAMSVGAPPDEFNPAGQDWGLAPFHPLTVTENDFAPMRQLMDCTMRHAGAIRLDHVLGLKRVYMVPHGRKAADGVYVRFPFEPLLRVVAEESVKLRCSVIGEDLGTVPEGFRETMAKWGLWTYRVMLFEREGDGRFRPPDRYPAEALATFNTHDMPSFRGWMQGHDLQVKRALGLATGESDDARGWALAKLRDLLAERAPDYSPDDFAGVAFVLGTTPCRLVSIALDDLLGEIEQINIPGTVNEHPNWRRRLSVSLEALADHVQFKRVGEALARAGRSNAA
jgi:4-alpha-glucanotransferase